MRMLKLGFVRKFVFYFRAGGNCLFFYRISLKGCNKFRSRLMNIFFPCPLLLCLICGLFKLVDNSCQRAKSTDVFYCGFFFAYRFNDILSITKGANLIYEQLKHNKSTPIDRHIMDFFSTQNMNYLKTSFARPTPIPNTPLRSRPLRKPPVFLTSVQNPGTLGLLMVTRI